MQLQNFSKTLVPLATLAVGGAYAMYNEKNITKHIYPYKSAKDGYICAKNFRLGLKKESGTIFVLGGSGAGKTTRFNNCNILDESYPGSMIIFDVKDNELFDTLCNPLKKNNVEVKLLSYKNLKITIHFNPWDAYNGNLKRLSNLITCIMPLTWTKMTGLDEPKNSDWLALASSLLNVIVYHVDVTEGRNFYEVKRLLELKLEDFENELINSKSNKVKSEFNRFLNSMMNKKGENDLSKYYNSIRSTVTDSFKPFIDDENILEITKYTDFDLKDLFNKDKKTFLFYCSKLEDSRTTYAPFDLLVFNLLYDGIIKIKSESKKYKKMPIRIVLDEFENMGKISDLPVIVKTCRNKMITLILLTQSYIGTKIVYDNGVLESMLQSMSAIIALPNVDKEAIETIFRGKEPINMNGEKMELNSTTVGSDVCYVWVKDNPQRFEVFDLPDHLIYEYGRKKRIYKSEFLNKIRDDMWEKKYGDKEEVIEHETGLLQKIIEKDYDEIMQLRKYVMESKKENFQKNIVLDTVQSQIGELIEKNKKLSDENEKQNRGLSKKDKIIRNQNKKIEILKEIEKCHVYLLEISKRLSENKYLNPEERENDINIKRKYQKKIKKLQGELISLEIN